MGNGFAELGRKLEDKYPSKLNTERIPTRSKEFNDLLGGGVPVGCVVTFWGEPKVGKTHMALEFCRAFCKDGKNSVWLDFENSTEEGIIKGFGLDEYNQDEQFRVHHNLQSTYDLEEILDGTTGDIDGYLVRPETDLVVIDSLAGVTPTALMEGSVSDGDTANKTIEDTQLVNKISSLAGKNDTTIVFVQQQRADVQASMATGYDLKKSAGGNALDHFTHVKFKMKRNATVDKKDGSVDYGEVQIEMEKNKTGEIKPEKTIPIRYGKGFDEDLIIMNTLQNNKDVLSPDIFEKSGSWKKLHLPSGDYQKQSKQAFEKEVIAENREEIKEILEHKGLL